MNTNRLSVIMGAITVAIHLAGFAVVDIGAKHVLAQTAKHHDLDSSRADLRPLNLDTKASA